MKEDNIESNHLNNQELASRLSRLGARIINVLLTYFLFWFIAPYTPIQSATFGIIVTVLGLIIFITQFIWLTRYGQSVGKKILKIKIVKVQTGENGGFVTNIILRGLVNSLISIIPIYILVDIFFIFKRDRRCIHDLIAGTKVIKVK